jgi:CubicO group peptidase (beta-lactamase class C family)
MKFVQFAAIIILFSTSNSNAQSSLYFPPLLGDEWETISLESLGWCEEKIPALYDYLEENNTKAFLVLKDGKIVLEKYFDTFTLDSNWYWASAGKGLTSFLTGIAQEEGFLNVEDKTSDYLGEGWTSCTPAQEEQIKVWNQLTMTSGLSDETGDAFCTDPECLIYKADAGERWAYHNGPYTLLDDVISNATGSTLNSFHTSRVKLKTGMDGLFVPVEENNVYFSTPRSMARFGLLMLNNGIWDDEVVLGDETYLNAMVNTSQPLNKAYGYLWWLNGKASFMLPQSETVYDGPLLPNAPADMYAAIGKNAQYLNVVPSKGLIVIRMGQDPTGLESLVPTLFNNEIWDYLNQLMCEVSELDEIKDAQKTKVYPNPADQFICVENELYTNYELYDALGRIQFRGELTIGNNYISMEEINDAFYYLVLKNENRQEAIKILK